MIKKSIPITTHDQMRTIAWAHEVMRRAQIKMTAKLAKDDPFAKTRKDIEKFRWSSNQRPKKNRNKIVASDISSIVMGNARNDFEKYTDGSTVKLTNKTLELIDAILPGTKLFYEVGYKGVPLWAAMRGEITQDDFWKPLVLSRQADDVLELYSVSGTLLNEWEAKEVPVALGGHFEIEPTGFHFDSLEIAEIKRVSQFHWVSIVHSLKMNLMARAGRDDFSEFTALGKAHKLGLRPSMGEAVLKIALAQQVTQEPLPLEDSRQDLQTMLRETMPVWEKWDDLYHLQGYFYGELVKLADSVSIKP